VPFIHVIDIVSSSLASLQMFIVVLGTVNISANWLLVLQHVVLATLSRSAFRFLFILVIFAELAIVGCPLYILCVNGSILIC
jgi:hypothetical protein